MDAHGDVQCNKLITCIIMLMRERGGGMMLMVTSLCD
jgi:hypothetical protein